LQAESVLDRDGQPTGQWRFDAHGAARAFESPPSCRRPRRSVPSWQPSRTLSRVAPTPETRPVRVLTKPEMRRFVAVWSTSASGGSVARSRWTTANGARGIAIIGGSSPPSFICGR
jgi:hypothetical protein